MLHVFLQGGVLISIEMTAGTQSRLLQDFYTANILSKRRRVLPVGRTVICVSYTEAEPLNFVRCNLYTIGPTVVVVVVVGGVGWGGGAVIS